MDERRLGNFLRRLLFVGILFGIAFGQSPKGESQQRELSKQAGSLRPQGYRFSRNALISYDGLEESKRRDSLPGTKELGSDGSHQGSTARELGSDGSQPGSSAPKLGSDGSHPGSSAPELGSDGSQPGSSAPELGSDGSQPGSSARTVGSEESNSAAMTESRAGGNEVGAGHFELGAVRNEIWAPVKTTSILNGYAQRSRLEGGAATNFLQGNVSFDANGTALSAVQRLLHPRILSGYTMLKPQLSSGVFNDLSAQIAKSQPLMAEIANAKKEMDAQLAKSQPQFPNKLFQGIPKTDNANTVSPDLVAQLNRSHSTVQFDIAQAKMQMDAELARAKPAIGLGLPGKLPTVKNTKVPLSIPLPSTKVQIDSEVELAKREMQLQLAHAKPSIGPDLSNDLNWQIYRGNKETQAEILSAKPQLDAVYTKLRQAPQTATSINLFQQTVDANASYEKNILWDPWYARVARLYAPRLLQAMKKRGSPSGSNTVSITVWPNHRLEATLLDADNSKFDDATLEAYRSLSGNPALQFPAGSHRQQVTFLIDNKHDSETPVSGINSQTYKGDKEIQGYKY